MNTRDQTLFLLQQKANSFAPLPTVINKLDALINTAEPNYDLIADTIHTDVTLTTRLLHIANSPFFGLLRQVSSIKDVIILLGLVGVRNLVLGCKLMDQTNDFNIWQFIDQRIFWRHSMAVAYTAKALAELTNDDDIKAYAFTLGIIHRIGLCNLANSFPDQYQQILLGQKPLELAEVEIFGLNYYEAGGLLCKQWNLPPHLVNAITGNNNDDNTTQDLRNLLNLSTMLVPLLGYGESRQTVVFNIQLLLSELDIDNELFQGIWSLLPAQLSTLFEHNPNSDNTPFRHDLTHITAYCDAEDDKLKQALHLLLNYYNINKGDNSQVDLILQCSKTGNKDTKSSSTICDLTPFIKTFNKQTVVNWVELHQHLVLALTTFVTHTTKRVML